MKTAVIYVGYGSGYIADERFYFYGLDISMRLNVIDTTRLRYIARVAFENSDGVIFVYTQNSWPDLQKTMLVEFERSSVFVEDKKPYVVAKGFKKVEEGLFFDYVYDKPVLFIPADLKEGVQLNDILKPFASDRVIVKVFGEDLSKDANCIYADEVESVLSASRADLSKYRNAYTVKGETAERALFNVLKEREKVKIATAESCTAGLVCSRIANIPGVSEFLEGGVITYSNKLKVNVVKVNPNLLYKVGAVSEEVAYQMAIGALNITASDYAVSVTGIAGPGGATDTKPVGLVWFGFASKKRVFTQKMVFSGNRAMIRDKSARFAILKLREFIVKE